MPLFSKIAKIFSKSKSNSKRSLKDIEVFQLEDYTSLLKKNPYKHSPLESLSVHSYNKLIAFYPGLAEPHWLTPVKIHNGYVLFFLNPEFYTNGYRLQDAVYDMNYAEAIVIPSFDREEERYKHPTKQFIQTLDCYTNLSKQNLYETIDNGITTSYKTKANKSHKRSSSDISNQRTPCKQNFSQTKERSQSYKDLRFSDIDSIHII